jgi:L-ribulokinase
MTTKYSIGLDYGTNSVRAVLAQIGSPNDLAESVFEYKHGTAGIVLDSKQPELARQHPEDYVEGAKSVIRGVLEKAKSIPGFNVSQIVGIGVDTTGSTPIPVDKNGVPLALKPAHKDDPDALAVLWKDHTGHLEASEITALASKIRPQFLAKCGGIYSSEWFWAKILRNKRVRPDLQDEIYTWVELADYVPAVMTDTTAPDKLKRGICAAGHKAMFNDDWGGYPDAEFLGQLDARLVEIRATLPDNAYPVGVQAGLVSDAWAAQTGLKAGTPVSVGAFDAHLGGVGSGITKGALVKTVGTSTCDLMIAPIGDKPITDVPGICGIVPGSIIPGYYGLEAGQSAVGDIFNWFVREISPKSLGHQELNNAALKLKPGESGLISLDWHNGNRTILVDQRLTGAVLGLTLSTSPAELYRAWVEGTGYGARAIVERLEEYGNPVERIICCGGIAIKSALTMQIYADIIGRPIYISSSSQACAHGAAIAGAVAGGAYDAFEPAIAEMTALDAKIYQPIPENVAVYEKLYQLYKQLHDSFGVKGTKNDLSGVMKELLEIRSEVRNG